MISNLYIDGEKSFFSNSPEHLVKCTYYKIQLYNKMVRILNMLKICFKYIFFKFQLVKRYIFLHNSVNDGASKLSFLNLNTCAEVFYEINK